MTADLMLRESQGHRFIQAHITINVRTDGTLILHANDSQSSRPIHEWVLPSSYNGRSDLDVANQS